MHLRPYQVEAITSLMEAAGHAERRAATETSSAADRVLCVQPTGAGKTVLVLALASRVLREWGWRSLIIVPSRELVAQTVERAVQFIPQAKVGRISGGAAESGEVIVATAASLHERRLEATASDGFQLVVIDEAHHAAAESCSRILKHFARARLIVGVTATYRRGYGI